MGRIEDFVTAIVEQDAVWGLGDDDGWAAGGDDAGHDLLAVWPSAAAAGRGASGEWAGREPESLSVEAFADWLEDANHEGIGVLVFAEPDADGEAVSARRLLELLDAAT